MKNMFKGLLKSKEELYPGLSIERDQDRYWNIIHTRTNRTLIVCASEAKAKEAAEKLQKTHNWNKRNTLEKIKERDGLNYNKIIEIIQKYSEEKEYNGAYLDTIDKNSMVEYHLQQIGWVKGELLTYGTAVRKMKNEWSLDHISSGLILTRMKEEEHIKKLVKSTMDIIDWDDERTPFVIQEQDDIKEYLTLLSKAITENKELPEMNVQLKMKMDFLIEKQTKEKLLAFERAMDKLHGLVGLENIKNEIRYFMESLRGEKKLLQSGGIKIKRQALHMLFVGPPGSGKTEVARIISDILYSLGFTNENKCVEVSRKDLVSEYVGETTKKTGKVIEKALGGVLFVDEAYTLKSGDQQDFGRQALDEIMRAMENHRENLVVIFAGYEADIMELLKMNDGLQSRFPYTFHFQDYTPKQIAEIGIRMLASRGYDCSSISESFERAVKKRAKNGTIPGNARAARTFVERIVQMHKIRIGKESDHRNIRKILPDDIEASSSEINGIKDEEGLRQIREEGLKKLNQMIGLTGLKEEIKTWINFIEIENKRYQQGLISEKPSMHMTFEGDPGTGKTTVAKIVGQILKGTGMLSNGHFTELSRADMVGQYQGHTSDKVKRIVTKALGGILFIDEAYDLVNGENDSFGKELVNTLILEMENNRENLVVILAGYTEQMDELLQTNPGFESRIAERFLFPNYSADELFDLAILRLNELHLKPELPALELLKTEIKRFVNKEGKVNGNGRWVRKLCDKIKLAQANRLIKTGSNQLEIITTNDILEGVKRL